MRQTWPGILINGRLAGLAGEVPLPSTGPPPFVRVTPRAEGRLDR